jgi:hypothetical protein
MNTRLRVFAVFAVALALVCCIPSVGQVLKGSISGTVVDPQGAVVANAQVTAKNVDTGIVSTTTTDNSGLYRLNLLPSGTYNVSISGKGFKTTESKGVAVSAGADSGMGTVRLSVGETSTTVEVTAAAPLIETTQAQITNTFSGTVLQSFAGIQENEGMDRLALFVPGVAASRSDNFSNTNGVGFSSNGLRGRSNDQEIDGQNNNDNSVGGPGLFLSNTEFVGSYVIVTNNFGPEYGRNAGSVVNILTKGGSNGWHGSVFGQETNSYLDALNNTQKNTNKPGTTTPFTGPPRSNEEFSGGTVGGPIVKNKWFIFGGMDSDIFAGNTVFTTTSLTPTPAGLATLAACPSINAGALGILSKFGPYSFTGGNPTPRATQIPTSGSNFIASCPGVQYGGVTRVLFSPFHGYDFVIRTDANLGGDTITARYLYNRQNSFNGTGTGSSGWLGNVPALSQGQLLSWTHPFSPRMVNEARVSFSRLGVEFGGGFNSFLPAAGALDQALTNITFQAGNGLTIGPATNLPQSRLVNTWQGQDNWNWVLGKHSLKAGVNWTYQRSPNVFLPLINGSYRFANLSSFLTTDTPNRVQIAQGAEALDFREYDTFLYAGDDWKLGQNLTLNLGLTWTYYGNPGNLFNQITAPREANASTAFWLTSLPPSVTTDATVPSVTNSFGPSVGFAYSPHWGGFLGRITGNGKTTIRGGYRLLYDPPFYNIFLNESTSSPMTFLQTITTGLTSAMVPNTPTGPNVRAALGSFLLPNTFDPRTQNETNLSPNFGPNKVHTWSFGFEREVTKNAALEVRYVGNHDVSNWQTVDGNPYVGTASAPGQLQAGLLPAGTNSCAATTQVGPGAGTDVGRLACGLGVVRTRNNGAFSDYHGLQVEFRANNLFKQLTLRTGYTWAKTLDNVSEIFATGTAGNTLFAAQNPFQTTDAERSISGLNIPSAFTVIAIEQIPFFKEQHGVIGHILGGWTISADYILASGQPYSPEQSFGEALSTSPFGNVYDAAFVNAFVGADSARSFVGNFGAPTGSVGAFAPDACNAAVSGCSVTTKAAIAALPATQLVSINALNAATPTVVTVSKDQVQLIVNARESQLVFGTPFGNMPRNPFRDARSNLLNGTVYKNFKLGERANFEVHLTMNNALNHFNFASIVPNIENAGLPASNFGSVYASPATTGANGRVVWVGGKVSW